MGPHPEGTGKPESGKAKNVPVAEQVVGCIEHRGGTVVEKKNP